MSTRYLTDSSPLLFGLFFSIKWPLRKQQTEQVSSAKPFLYDPNVVVELARLLKYKQTKVCHYGFLCFPVVVELARLLKYKQTKVCHYKIHKISIDVRLKYKIHFIISGEESGYLTINYITIYLCTYRRFYAVIYLETAVLRSIAPGMRTIAA